MSSALALVVPCSSTVGRHGQSGLEAARRRRPGAAGRRATADPRVATFSPFLSFLRQSTHLSRGPCSWVGLEPASFYPLIGSHAFLRNLAIATLHISVPPSEDLLPSRSVACCAAWK